MSTTTTVTGAAITLVLVATLTACSPSPVVSERNTPSPTAPSAAPSESPSLVEPAASPDREAAYGAEIAAWTEPLPDGYSWPDFDGLPDVRGSQLEEAQNAPGIFRCILIDAAWHAYFEDNHPVAAKDYATRADRYLIPDNASIIRVSSNGEVLDHELPIAKDICRGISGALD